MLWHIVKALVALAVVVPLAACHDAHILDAGVQAEYHGATGVPLVQPGVAVQEPAQSESWSTEPLSIQPDCLNSRV